MNCFEERRSQEVAMSFWQLMGNFAFSAEGEVLQRVSRTTSVSSDGTTYTKMGPTTMMSDGSVYTQMGSFSSDGSVRVGDVATGIGAAFNTPTYDFEIGSSKSKDGFDSF